MLMEFELNDAKLRVYEDGRIERFGKIVWNAQKFTWHELKGCILIHPKSGYQSHKTTINYKLYTTARVIFYAYFPDLFDINDPITTIDHINRNSLDNRISNLRVATRTEQNLNREFKNAKGYYWNKGKWHAQIQINGKQIHLGYFNTEQDARQAYLNAKEKYCITL